jgi:hypothetical protein
MAEPIYTGLLALLDRLVVELDDLERVDERRFGGGELAAARDRLAELRIVIATATEPTLSAPSATASSDADFSIPANS